MKMKRTGMFGLSALLLCAASLFIANPASAQTYTCANVPSTNLGDVIIDEPGACTINHPVTADGNITINAVGNISVQALNAGYSVWLESTDGTITTNNAAINTNSLNQGGNILLVADGNISTGNLDTHSKGGIEIVANKGGGSTLFSIGSASANGVNGSLKSITTTFGGNDPVNHNGGIFVTNGDAASTGGITIANMSNIQVRTNASASRTGLLILNAQNGTLALPTGSLNADGGTNQMAGSIYLMAKTINTVNGTIITASQNLLATGTNRCVCISAQTVNVAGVNGLKLLSNGNGDQSDTGSLSLLPKGSITVASIGDYETMYWVADGSQQFITSAPMTVTGNAPLFLSANGSNTRVQVSGYPMTFSNGAVTIQSRGVTSHRVVMGYNGALNGTTQLAFTGTGNVNIDANGLAGAGGEVTIYGDKMTFNAPIFNISANGPPAGNGNGGTVYISSTAATLKATSKVTVTANAASVGFGDAILGEIGTGLPKAIQFFPGAVTLHVGTAAGQYSFQAKGGKTGGNGGTIYMGASSLAVKTAAAIDASALPTTAGGTGNGDGGEIYLNNYITVDPVATVSATGKGISKGGKFFALYFSATADDIDINRFINVNGGDALRATVESDFGQIKLNNTTCQQRTTGRTVWPVAYWNCANPVLSTPLDRTPALLAADSIFNGVRTLLNDNKINIYVFSGGAGYNNFFSDNLVPQTAGVTFRESFDVGRTIAVTVWQTGSIGTGDVVSFSENQVKEVTAHELGHAVDKSRGESTNSQSSLFDTYVSRDLNTLNFADPNFNITRRLPCSRTPDPLHPLLTDPLHFFPGAPPFENVEYLRTGVARVPVCLAGALNPEVSTNSSITNEEIMKIFESQFWQPEISERWVEAHAHLFAYGAVGNKTARPMNDGVTDNGYFKCLVAWGNSDRAGTLPTTSCTLKP